MSRDEEFARLSKDLDGRFGDASRARLEELMAMARVSRGWSGRQLAEFLDRDPHNIVPSSGVPKVDLVYRLARALGWSPAAVLEDICGDRVVAASQPPQPTSYAELNRAAYESFASGRFDEMIALALRAQAVARTPDERAEACLREAGGWDGLGRYVQGAEAIQRGLVERVDSPLLRAQLRVNLANAYLSLSQLTEADGVASSLLELDGDHDAESEPAWLGVYAFARFVRGQARRARMLVEPMELHRLARPARIELELAGVQYDRYAERIGVDHYRAIADACRGAVLCVDALSGALDGTEAAERVLGRIGEHEDVSTVPSGLWLECLGWWCVYGCEIAIGSIPLPADRERLAVFSNKGHQVADRGNHWALRERLSRIDFFATVAGDDPGVGVDLPTLDSEDVRHLLGIMGRFPSFRPVGWKILRRSPRV